MSYILEALRKAEQERTIDQASFPAMIYALPAPRQRRIWPWLALTLALLTNAAVFAALLLREQPAAPATPPVAQTPPPANVQIVIPPTAVLSPGQPQPAALPAVAAAPPATIEPELAADPRAAVRRPPTPRVERSTRTTAVEAAPYAALGNAGETRARSARRAPVDMAAEDMDPPTGGRLPDMAFAGGPAPELNMDVHVYSDQPGKRFVMINSKRYREGERLSEGPTVEAITQKGAILRYQGERFLLSVQNSASR